jgi:hypothetical protein
MGAPQLAQRFLPPLNPLRFMICWILYRFARRAPDAA